jgi:hypothetical protein
MTLISPYASVRPLTPAVLVVAAWFGLALAAGAAGVFASPPGAPPVAIGLASAVPPLVVIGWLAGSARFRSWVRDLDLRLLTLVQTWRVAGLAFLALYAVGDLPARFALPAGLGDVAVGLTAPLVAVYVIGGGRWARRTYIGWTVVGIVDLLLAVTLGVSSGSGVDSMASLPMSLVSTFGVPFTLALHAISLVNATRGAEFADR